MSSATASLKRLAKTAVKTALWSAVPLGVRKQAAIGISNSSSLSEARRLRYSMLAIGDLAEHDNREFHRFLWSNHLAYAVYYSGARFQSSIETSRLQLFTALLDQLASLGVEPRAISSVLDVGCSVGNNLRYLEEHVFPSATILHGVDIDSRAVAEGTRLLAQAGSRVELKTGDMEDLDSVLGRGTRYDVVFCAGVLLYLDEERAAAVVASMLRRSRTSCAFAALAHPLHDNQLMPASERRAWDSSHIHNVDRMVAAAGGAVVGRRWEPGTLDGRQTIYFVFARPRTGEEPAVPPPNPTFL